MFSWSRGFERYTNVPFCLAIRRMQHLEIILKQQYSYTARSSNQVDRG